MALGRGAASPRIPPLPRRDDEFSQPRSGIPRRRTIYWRTADVSANGPSMPSPGRFIGGVREVLIRAPLRFAEAPTGIRVICLKPFKRALGGDGHKCYRACLSPKSTRTAATRAGRVYS